MWKLLLLLGIALGVVVVVRRMTQVEEDWDDDTMYGEDTMYGSATLHQTDAAADAQPATSV